MVKKSIGEAFEVVMSENYALLRKGKTYRVLSIGRDYYEIKVGNKHIFVDPHLTRPQDEENTDDILNAYIYGDDNTFEALWENE